MTGPAISVVMTVYDKSAYLQDAVSSVLNQRFADFEFIIVVEYGASQELIDILRRSAKADERICLIYNQERLGLPESLNRGIRAARGKYIARMDDDDISLPDRFSKQIQFLETNPQIGVCGTYQLTVTPEHEAVLYCATKPQELKSELLFGCQISHTSVMFRRRLFIEHGWFYKKESMAEDFELWMRILNDVEFANIGEPLVRHRYGFGNISENKGQALILANRDIIRNGIGRYFGIEAEAWPEQLFYSWRNHRQMKLAVDPILFLQKGVQLLELLEERNAVGWGTFAEESAFLNTLMKRFVWYFRCLKMWKLARMLESQAVDDKKSFAGNAVKILEPIYPLPKGPLDSVIGNLFPLKKESRVIIWGNGQNWHDYIRTHGIGCLNKQFDVLGICDKNPIFSADIQILQTDEIIKQAFDYVIITSDRYYTDIKQELMRDYKVKESKIVFYEQILL